MSKRSSLAAAVLLSGASASALCLSELYRYTFRRSYSPLTGLLLDSKGHGEDYYRYRSRMKQYMENRPYESYSIISADGHRLQGYYYRSGEQPAQIIAFLVHGYRSEHNETVGPYYDYYMSRGIDIFACDHAAHGQSEGEVIGYGVTESRDCLQWLSFLLDTFGSDTKFILHGFSMGAATVMMMSDQVPSNVRFIVEDSGYARVSDILKPSLKVLYPPISALNRYVGCYELSDADPASHLSQTSVPFLFVHGRQDPSVPFDNAPELYKICPSEKDRLYSDARHVETMYAEPEAYKAILDECLRKYLSRR